MLVDTQIWAAALQDVRTRERVTRSRTQELGIERRLRLEEIQRAVIAQMQLQQAKEKIAADYAAAVEIALKEAGNAKEALSAAFGPLTIDDIQTKLRSVNADITRQSASLEPLRKIVMQFASECAVKMKVIDVEIVRTKEQLARLRATAAMSRASTNSSSIKLKIVTDQITHLVQSTDAQLASATNAYGKPVNDANLPTLLEEISQDIQELRSQVSMIDISLVTAKASLARIKELTSIPTPTITGPQPIIRRWIPAKQRLKPVPVSVSEPEPCVVHDSLGCPTCGSPLPIEKRMQREAEITREIDTQTLARRDIISRLDLKKTLLDTLTQVRESRMTLKPLMDRQREIQTELAGFEASLEVSVAELAVVEKTFQNITQSKETLEATLKQQEAQQLSDLSAQENILKAMQANEVRLRQDIEKVSAQYQLLYLISL